MSQEAPSEVEATKPTKRRGRPPGLKRKRHDPAPAPIDGDYQPLDIVGKQPGFAYVALSDRDRQRRGHQFTVERWAEGCAHPPWEVLNDDNRGKEVKVNGQLTLMRCPTEQMEARRKREMAAFRAASAGISANDEARGLKPQPDKITTTHTVNVSGAY